MEKIEMIISKEEINEKVRQIGKQISEDLNGESAVMICILKGAVVFAVDIARNIDAEIYFEFAELSSYGNETKSCGEIKVVKDIGCDIEGRNVIIVEDIIDTGRTLYFYINELKKRNPKSIKLCVLLDKKENKQFDIQADYSGFDIPDKFVVGYGLDYAQKYRNLDFIGEVIF